MFTGDIGGSRQFFEDGLRVARQIDDRLAEFYLLDALGCMAASSGEPRLAARLLGAAETIRTGAGASVNVLLAPLLAAARESASASLGETKFAAEFKAGKELGPEAAIALALGEAVSVAAEASSDAAGLLGKREADVAQLVAEGLSNKQIGARLFISERTVESHVRSILNKLGFNSRSQIANWIGASVPRISD